MAIDSRRDEIVAAKNECMICSENWTSSTFSSKSGSRVVLSSESKIDSLVTY
mgnify:CR=1 FL=1